MEEAAKIAQDGWVEGAEQAIRVRDRILAAYPPQKRPVKYGIAGTVPNIAKAVAGDLMNMRVPDEDKSRRRPVITLISNMAGSCMVDQKALSNRAAVVAALVDQIEAAGYSVEVMSTAYASSSYRRKDAFLYAVSVMAKPSDQPVDMKRLTFALGHASMFRRFVFADLGTQDIIRRNIGSGLGYTSEISIKSLEEKSVFYLPSCNKNSKFFKDEEKALTDGRQYMIDCLTKQKCPAFYNRKKFTDDDEARINKLNEDLEYVNESDVEVDFDDDD
jgi:hypothetical protein